MKNRTTFGLLTLVLCAATLLPQAARADVVYEKSTTLETAPVTSTEVLEERPVVIQKEVREVPVAVPAPVVVEAQPVVIKEKRHHHHLLHLGIPFTHVNVF